MRISRALKRSLARYLHGAPRVEQGHAGLQLANAVAARLERQGPVHEVQVQVVEPQILERSGRAGRRRRVSASCPHGVVFSIDVLPRASWRAPWARAPGGVRCSRAWR